MPGPRVETPAVVLRDGTPGVVRALHREDAGQDKERLREAYERLSPESRYRRFLAPVKALSPQMLHRLVDHVDGTSHVALVLDAVVADEHLPVGIGRYVRDQRREDRAEVAVTVNDDWQGRGVGALLVRALADRALEVGVTHFTATVLTGNTASLRMLAHGGRVVRQDLSYNGVLEVLVELS